MTESKRVSPLREDALAPELDRIKIPVAELRLFLADMTKNGITEIGLGYLLSVAQMIYNDNKPEPVKETPAPKRKRAPKKEPMPF